MINIYLQFFRLKINELFSVLERPNKYVTKGFVKYWSSSHSLSWGFSPFPVNAENAFKPQRDYAPKGPAVS